MRALGGLLPFVRPYRVQIGFAAVFLVLAALSTLVFPVALKSLIDQGFVSADPGARAVALRGHFFALFMVGVALGVFSAARFYMVSWIGERVTADVRNAVYAHVVRQSPEFFESAQTGEVLSRLTTDTTLVQTVVGSSLSMGLRNTVMGIGAMAMLIITNPVVMTQVLAILVLVVLPSLYFGRRVRGLSRASQDRIADSSAIAAEVLNAIPVVQSYQQEAREADRFVGSTERAFQTAVRRTKMRSFLVAFVISATFGALLWGLYQGTQAVVRGDISAGHLGQTVVYVIILIGSVAVLSEVYGDLLRAAGATERLIELLQMRSPIVSPPEPLALATPPAGASVEFDDVTFRYPSRPQQPTLAHFNLAVAPGETVALVGPSGAGKSTVLQLILRFYDVESGAVRVDGERVDRVSLDDLRKRIGIVPQDSVIFSTDAMENIRYGRPDASDDEVVAAARGAFAHDFIAALPEGYKTFLGERGVRLSGGQRQRIAIA
ncbi:MAG TPA: ABC transporter transmembrane domain-containing protein, partial [Caldimonas sp.]|nr:ABC transporter transmembrane domain-containing protein [Caldimonas sp.]